MRSLVNPEKLPPASVASRSTRAFASRTLRMGRGLFRLRTARGKRHESGASRGKPRP